MDITLEKKTYNERRAKEEYYQTHKREFAEKKVVPKWDPAGGSGNDFAKLDVD